MDEPPILHTHRKNFRHLLSRGALRSHATVYRMQAAHRARPDGTGSFSFWFALLSPVLGIAVGALGFLLFNLR